MHSCLHYITMRSKPVIFLPATIAIIFALSLLLIPLVTEHIAYLLIWYQYERIIIKFTQNRYTLIQILTIINVITFPNRTPQTIKHSEFDIIRISYRNGSASDFLKSLTGDNRLLAELVCQNIQKQITVIK
jgi:hypothetical protein